MNTPDTQKLTAFLSERFKDALIHEKSLEPDKRKPFMVCAILTDSGNIFGSVAHNLATQDNLEGSSPLGESLSSMKHHQSIMKQIFQISVVGMTTTIDPQSPDFTPLDWDVFGKEKRDLEEAGIVEILYLNPNTQQHMMREL